MLRLALLALLGLSVAHSADAYKRQPSIKRSINQQSVSASPVWNIDASKPVYNVSTDMWGVFFEEINHAGHGGLYTQSIANSNFEDARSIVDPWTPYGEVLLSIYNLHPSSAYNTHSLRARSLNQAAGAVLGISNPGFYGASANYSAYNISMYVRSSTIESVTVWLTSADGHIHYGRVTVDGITNTWSKKTVQLLNGNPQATNQARFLFTWSASGAADESIFFDVVTAFPQQQWRGLTYVRADLAEAMANMKPSFVRFPGGCFSEGDRLINRFNWKNALGPIEQRPGHWNLWNYWTEDGLGLFEFLEIIERLTDVYNKPTRAIWVVNNGISHDESLTDDQLEPYIQDALDSMEFAMGAPSTEWGRLRAEMGHPAPFVIDYVAIGNEDCGKPNYFDSYAMFYKALKDAYPNVTLISNCDPHQMPKATTEVWDYHLYPNSQGMIAASTVFDGPYYRGVDSKIFVSEYAVHGDSGNGNLLAALAEAVFMTGMERNSDIVTMASYAPLYVNAGDRRANPDAIVFNSYQTYGTPSYWNGVMWAQAYANVVPGSMKTLNYDLDASMKNVSVAVTIGTSMPLSEDATPLGVMIMKLVNVKNTAQVMRVEVNGLPKGSVLGRLINIVTMSGSDPKAENTFNAPTAIAPVNSFMQIIGTGFDYTLPPWSIVIIRAYVQYPQMQADQ